ncbi:DUF4340 domain-containing protein [Gracilibacillus marinus]|uniref:DUF4340 domain-containing protein n=1 Tax=Gracilibacillus marinus TaxID=630535 RepID=A0ABV8VW88_9BACI
MKLKPIILIVLFIVVLSVIFFIITNNKESDEEVTTEQIVEDFNQLTNIQVRANENVQLEKKENTWKVKEVEREQDDEKVQYFIEAMQYLTGEKTTIDKKLVNLDFPKVTVVFTDNENKMQRVSVGQMDATASKYYVNHMEKDQIYLVDRNAIESIPLKPTSLLDNSIITLKSNELEEVVIDNGTEQIVLNKSSFYTELESLAHISGWYVHKPFHSTYSMSYSQTEQLLNGIEPLQKVEVIEEQSEIGEVDFTITFKSKEKEQTLQIGNPAANQHYYAKLEGNDQIFTLTNESLVPFSYPAFDMIDHFVHIVPLQAIQSLQVESNQVNWTLTGEKTNVDADDKELSSYSFAINGKEMDTEALQESYKHFAGLTFDKQVENFDKEGKDALYTITYSTNADEDTILTFYEYDDTYLAFEKNKNGVDFIVKKAKLAQALESMNKLTK